METRRREVNMDGLVEAAKGVEERLEMHVVLICDTEVITEVIVGYLWLFAKLIGNSSADDQLFRGLVSGKGLAQLALEICFINDLK